MGKTEMDDNQVMGKRVILGGGNPKHSDPIMTEKASYFLKQRMIERAQGHPMSKSQATQVKSYHRSRQSTGMHLIGSRLLMLHCMP